MKRFLCLILALLMAVLSACHYRSGGDILEPVEFFYPRKSTGFIYGSDNGVITSEVREGAGHISDLNYLITMYLYGPQDDDLRSPFPVGCTLKGIRSEGDTLYIRLNETFTTIEGTELTLACAALAKTCLSMTDFTNICIDARSDEKTVSMTLDAESVLFADQTALEETVATENPQ